MSTQTTHHVSSTDTGLLLQFLGILSILFAIITIFDPQWWLLATLPLTLIGLTLLLLPRRPGFQKLIEALDPSIPKKAVRSGPNRRERKSEMKAERQKEKKAARELSLVPRFKGRPSDAQIELIKKEQERRQKGAQPITQSGT